MKSQETVLTHNFIHKKPCSKRSHVNEYQALHLADLIDRLGRDACEHFRVSDYSRFPMACFLQLLTNCETMKVCICQTDTWRLTPPLHTLVLKHKRIQKLPAPQITAIHLAHAGFITHGIPIIFDHFYLPVDDALRFAGVQ